MTYKEFFKEKKIAVIGLGPHGEMIADIKFLLKHAGEVTLYDLRSHARMKGYLPKLKEAGLEKHAFGEIPKDDLAGFDLIVLSPEISKKSHFLKAPIRAGIQVEFPETLFFKLAPIVTLIGVMGVCGKTTVSQLIYSILKKSFAEHPDQGFFFIDPESSNGALTHLKKIKKGDVLLARIPEYMMEHYYAMRISPHVAVVTGLSSLDPRDVKRSLSILEFQTYNNFIVASDVVMDAVKAEPDFASKAKILRTRKSSVPKDWTSGIRATHALENAALALQTSELFKVPTDIARDIIATFLGLKGRIEFVKKVANVDYYNDTASITPHATLSALRTLATHKNIVLIFGGAYTGHDYGTFLRSVAEFVTTIVLLPGSGTLGLRDDLMLLPEVRVVQVPHLEDAVKKARDSVRKGDIVLFSPGFEAVGFDISRKERGERFVKAVRAL